VLSQRVIHPFLFGLWPILFLTAQNMGEMALSRTLSPLLGVTGVILIMTVVFRALRIEPHRLGMGLSALVLAFFSFGYLVCLLPERFWFLSAPVLAGGLLSAGLGLLWLYLWRSRRSFVPVTGALNLAAVVLVVWQVAAIGWSMLSRSEVTLLTSPIAATSQNHERPDIYYIIPDGYGRSDILSDIYDYDNTDFIAFLRSQGFYVADSACSNYCQTLLSMTSSLNLDYLQSLFNLWRLERDRTELLERFPKNRLFEFLREQGYEIWSFQTGTEYTDLPSADRFLHPNQSVNEFENLLLSTTPLPYLFPNRYSQYDLHRRRIEFTLKSLADCRPGPRPKLVFAHFIAPHPPFVYDRTGKKIEPERPFNLADCSAFELFGGAGEEYVVGYRDQIEYITGCLQTTIASLLANYGERPPVVLVQGDHGPGSRTQFNLSKLTDLNERLSILNALLIPGVDSAVLRPSLSPVNSFRLVCNCYFGTDYPLLPDSVFWSPFSYPYDFENVTDKVR